MKANNESGKEKLSVGFESKFFNNGDIKNSKPLFINIYFYFLPTTEP